MPFDATNAKQHGAIGGRIGGARGRGQSKARGGPDYYRALVEKRAIFSVDVRVRGKMVHVGYYRDLAVAVRAISKSPKGKLLSHPGNGRATVRFNDDAAVVEWENGESVTVYFQPWACRTCGAPACFPYHSRTRLCDECAAVHEPDFVPAT